MKIVDLGDAPEYFDAVADRIWQAWWRPNGAALADVAAALRGHLGAESFPFSLVATVDGEFAGTVSAIASDLEARPELGPWVAALWVEPERRGGAIGAALMGQVMIRLHEQGVERVYLCAKVHMRPYYLSRGWRLIATGEGDDKLDVFEQSCAAPSLALSGRA